MCYSEVLKVQGFVWYGLNRKDIHKNARKGSGGVGFLINELLLKDYGISVLDNKHEGILWLKLKHKFLDYAFAPCVWYLPPENSSRQVDVSSFYDHLIACVYQYQAEGDLVLCGDFNSRCGDLDDYITGVDDVPRRDVIDNSTNRYGELFINFLIF